MATKFKEGDWFVMKHTGVIFRANVNDVTYQESTLRQAYMWKPKVDEWCWFWTSSTKPVLRQFNATQPNGLHKTTVGQFLYENYEPFIGELPTPYKDK